MSVRKENRWRKTIQNANDAISDRQREIEAAFMVREIRPAVTPPPQSATRRQVRRWMRQNVSEYDGNMTFLAEGANAALNLPDGALDDETHWIWDEALNAVEWFDDSLLF